MSSSGLPGLLAAAPSIPTTIDGASRITLSGVLPVIAVIAVVLGFAVIWAIFLRSTPRDPRDRYLTDDSPASGHRRRRHRRREHRPTNPTLAETGGLPPARPEHPRKPDP